MNDTIQADEKVLEDNVELEMEMAVESADADADENAEYVNGEEDELSQMKKKYEELAKKNEQYYEMLQRSAAEFDNYKKRTIKEKEALYSDAKGGVAAAFLPVMDNMERAISASVDVDDANPLKEGVSLVHKQLVSTFKNLGIEEIKALGEQFNPELHHAVMHIEDESLEANMVIEEFQKGYTINGKVIRHSMVKVAN